MKVGLFIPCYIDAALFANGIGTDPKDSDPHDLAEAMRQNARPRFMSADAGMTGANFAVAETGGDCSKLNTTR